MIMLRKLLTLILFAFMFGAVVLNAGPVYALGDYHWMWVHKQIPVIDEPNISFVKNNQGI